MSEINPNQYMWDTMTTSEIFDFMESPETDEKSKQECLMQMALRGVTPEQIAKEHEDRRLDREKKDKADRFNAQFSTCSLSLATHTIYDLMSRKTNPNYLAEEVCKDVIGKVEKKKPNKILLASHLLTLDSTFNLMVRRAIATDNLEAAKTYMDIALRAQNQSRKTVLALEQLKNPKQQTYITQQNNAVNQLVSNQSIAGETQIQKNVTNKVESLNSKSREATYEILDSSRTREAIPADTRTKTMDAFNGS